MKSLPTFLPVFEQKLRHFKGKIEKELAKPKAERTKIDLKSLLREAKGLKKTINKIKKDNSMSCPNCGHDL